MGQLYNVAQTGYIVPVSNSVDKIMADKKQVEYIMNYLHENREVKLTKDIKRNYTK